MNFKKTGLQKTAMKTGISSEIRTLQKTTTFMNSTIESNPLLDRLPNTYNNL
jgi:hypothetical protein